MKLLNTSFGRDYAVYGKFIRIMFLGLRINLIDNMLKVVITFSENID